VDATKLNAVVGGDHPVGPTGDRRRGLFVRKRGKTAAFLTVIEPYESEELVESVKAEGPDSLVVTLSDGRKHHYQISGFHGSGDNITVKMIETKSCEVKFRESTAK
jgi:4-aminobutyrate aminotransferase-like enzyme